MSSGFLRGNGGSQGSARAREESVIDLTRATVRPPGLARVVASGKYLHAGDEPFRVRGVTYGSFVPRRDGALYPEPARIHADFSQMAAMGANTVRVYTAPPDDLLDAAVEHGLRLIVGVDYRDWRYEPSPGRAADRRVVDGAMRAIDEALAKCAGRTEVLAISVGNEVPGDIVRVHEVGRVEAALSGLVQHVRRSDPGTLVTYTNYPTTEFLQIADITLATFNVFLEDRDALRRYLRHLQVASGPVPLVITELGLAGEVHGEDAQAQSLAWQLRIVDQTGCAGATVFSFTDEWGVDGQPVKGWGFGITDHGRTPKPAATVVRSWAKSGVEHLQEEWPTISVVVCAYNEQRTIEQCLASLAACDYPGLEVLLCDDGSTDRTLELARRFPFRIIELPHGGLSRARNAGIEAATGEIVAFLDADAACHPEWPWRLAMAFENERVVAAGGPNLPFPDAPFVERTVALSPGAPLEVLLSDDRAEHVPGCNMAFRRDAIRGVGAFDPIYTSAGDDVDVCWKLLDGGGEIAFSPAAQIFHHRRATVRGYLRQQRGYGRAEKLLMPAHRHRFNRLGQAKWSGFIYGGVRLLPSVLRPVVYHGYQGHAPFQSIASRPGEQANAWAGALLPLTAPLAAIGILAAVLLHPWWLLLAAVALAGVVAYGVSVAVALRVPREEPEPAKLRCLVGALHVAQPFVRTWGRLRGARRPMLQPVARPWWGDRSVWLQDIERQLRARGANVRIGGPTDDWDLEVRGWFCRARITTAIAWRWEPQRRVEQRVRIGSSVLAVGLAAVVASLLSAPLVVACGAAAVVAIGCVRTRRVVSEAIGRCLVDVRT
jgi:glycosyltransferase involved in cell wall biosynthesis